MDQSLIINYQQASASGSSDQPWVRLEQISPSGMDDFASLSDLHEMWMAAASGQSARLVRASTCPVEFDGANLHVYLGFYAWPSSPDLQFSLSPSLGELSQRVAVSKEREFSILLNNTDGMDLDYYFVDAEAEWETPCFDQDGNEIEPPSLTITGTKLDSSLRVFGVARIRGAAMGYQITAKMTMEKPLEEAPPEEETSTGPDDVIWIGKEPGSGLTSWKIENLENTITATWQDLEGKADTDQLRLLIPQCVEAVLAMCPDMYQTITRLCQTVYSKEVYWNPCSGEVVMVRKGPNPQRFCTDISHQTVLANPWGVGTLPAGAF